MKKATERRVLIVDDAPEFIRLISAYLRDGQYVIETAENGVECLKKANAFHPDVIILDIMMSGMHGFEVLKQLKSDPELFSIGVIMCSGKDFRAEKETAKQLGAFGFITKPFSQEDIIALLDDYFSGKDSSLTGTHQPSHQPSSHADLNKKVATPFIKFWGTRGSVPVSGPEYVVHGGNTPCLEIFDGENTIIIDAGTGIRELGLRLMKELNHPLHLFIGHTHWDHIQGFPFFNPVYRKETSLTLYGASGFKKDLRSIFIGQLDADYFPVQLSDIPSSIQFKQLSASPIVIGEQKIFWEYVHHPGAAIGFKFSVNGKTVVYITDNEFLNGYTGSPGDAESDSKLLYPYENLIGFIRDTDILISEAQYTDEEYPVKIGWGHTSLSNGCLLCKLGSVKEWVITHHDPMHTDEFLARKLERTKEILASLQYSIPVSHATDGRALTF